jgi:hypothetical protein
MKELLRRVILKMINKKEKRDKRSTPPSNKKIKGKIKMGIRSRH